MKQFRVSVSLSALAFGLIASAAITLADDKAEEGFKSIFNGKDLTGWDYGRAGKGENKSAKGYQVENGVIFCTKEDGGNLYTEKEYADFILRFEFKLEPNANNGIAIRAPLEGDSAFAGMEIQVLDDTGPQYAGKLAPYQYHGSIYGVVPAKQGALKPVGEWNEEEITCKGRQVTVKLNGKLIVDANLDDIKEPVDKRPHPGLSRTKGHIGFLGHGARVEFRKLRVKEL